MSLVAAQPEIDFMGRMVGPGHAPLVIAEIGINHEGSLDKAIRMVDDAAAAGCECVKFQSHVIDDEMIPNDVVPGNATESIWDIMSRCALSEADERRVKRYVEQKGLLYLCTPFSRAAALRLESMGVAAYKIGSGECNNIPLLRLVASFGKPVFLSTGMNDLESVAAAVRVFERAGVPYALFHCTSMYPTPYDKVRLGALEDLRHRFPRAVLGLSDHSLGAYTCFAAIARGASVVEKHFTSTREWPGPDVPISLDPAELKDLVAGAAAIWQALGGRKTILPEEQPTIDFAYASVVTTAAVAAGEPFTEANTWVKRPGTGEIRAADFDRVLGRRARHAIPAGTAVGWADIAEPTGTK